MCWRRRRWVQLLLAPQVKAQCSLNELSVTIHKVCCEFTCKCSDSYAHASTMSILNMLGSFSWDAKVVIALAAFAVAYGEWWLVMRLRESNPLARSLATLEQTPEIYEINGKLKSKFEAISNLTVVMVDVAKALVKFRLLISKFDSLEAGTPFSTSINHFKLATYWTIRSIIACWNQIGINFSISSWFLSSSMEVWDLFSLAHMEKAIHDQLLLQLDLCYEYIDIRKEDERFNHLVLLFKTAEDNVKSLKALINPNNDIHPLVVGSPHHTGIVRTVIDTIFHHHHEGRQVDVDVLSGKTVLLLISNLDILEEDVLLLDKIYTESRKKKHELVYDVVWLPVVDNMIAWTEDHENKFKKLQHKMPWYSLLHPSFLDAPAIRFIKEVWGFCKKHIVVSLDPIGPVINRNALHMIVIWGNSAYPFTSAKEEEMWSKQTRSLDFVVDSIRPDIHKWLAHEDTYICLFGGDDNEWIRTFAASMKEYAAKMKGIKLELLYIGKQNADKEFVKRIRDDLKSERLAHTLSDLNQVHYFWSRLESILHSRMHLGKNVENDNIVADVMSLMSCEDGGKGCVVIGSGRPNEIVRARGELILTCFSKYSEWAKDAKKIGFFTALLQCMAASQDQASSV